MNAKQEFLDLIKGKSIFCAEITLETGEYDDDWNQINTHIDLKYGFNEQDLEEFLNKLDFEYDSGYGTQYLFGTIWFDFHTWAEREEYDGSEWWCIKKCPVIPEHLCI